MLYDISLTTVVYSESHQALMTMNKLITDCYPSATSIFGYPSWEAGKLPNQFQATKKYYLLLDAVANEVAECLKDSKVLALSLIHI